MLGHSPGPFNLPDTPYTRHSNLIGLWFGSWWLPLANLGSQSKNNELRYSFRVFEGLQVAPAKNLFILIACWSDCTSYPIVLSTFASRTLLPSTRQTQKVPVAINMPVTCKKSNPASKFWILVSPDTSSHPNSLTRRQLIWTNLKHARGKSPPTLTSCLQYSRYRLNQFKPFRFSRRNRTFRT